MIIPHDQLRPETLAALIEEFVTRDGAVQGHQETPMAQRVAAVRRQLAAGEAVVVFNADDETADIVMRDRLPTPLTDAGDDAGEGGGEGGGHGGDEQA